MRKLILAAALALGLSAQAGTIVQFPNDVGGTINLSDEQCPEMDNLLIAYSTHPQGDVLFGCWVYVDDGAMVTWRTPSGGRRVRFYTTEGMTITDYGRTVQKNRGK